MHEEVKETAVLAVQEPGYSNVWMIQTETGVTVARMTVGDDAEAWAVRIADALNAQINNHLIRVAKVTAEKLYESGLDLPKDKFAELVLLLSKSVDDRRVNHGN